MSPRSVMRVEKVQSRRRRRTMLLSERSVQYCVVAAVILSFSSLSRSGSSLSTSGKSVNPISNWVSWFFQSLQISPFKNIHVRACRILVLLQVN